MRITPRSVVLGIVASATAAPPALADCPDADRPAAQLPPDTMNAAIRCEVNEERRSRDLPPVEADRQIARAAAAHTDDMLEHGFFAHAGSDGSGPALRVRRTGYLERARRWVVGEVLAWGSGSRSAPRALVRAWMHSPPHRKVMLDERYRAIGVDVRRGAPGQSVDTAATATAVFGVTSSR